ncbi:MAG: hypothetical protein AAFZ01_03825 [Pseudomonadota bacterium]
MSLVQETSTIHDTIAAALTDPEVGWSMGSFGALAEFHQDQGEPDLPTTGKGTARATQRGAIQLNDDMVAHCTPVAYEQLSKNRARWGQGLALCLPEERAIAARRKTLTRLGVDTSAITEKDNDALLYDMGLDLQQCDFCVRTDNPELITVLDDNEGRSLFEPDNPAMAAILRHHPHRVVLTPLGRVEVFQKIGGPDTGGKSPPGPHTHVLPNLMRARKTHAANITVPAGLIPCAYLHPGNPLVDSLGAERAYRADLAHAFDKLYTLYAPEDLRALKLQVSSEIDAGNGPQAFSEPTTRAGRLTLRVALRQLAQSASAADDTGRVTRIRSWLSTFDGADREFSDEPDEQAEHG